VSGGGFRVTANMVTMARIVALPVPCALILHGSKTAMWIAFVIGALLGATDFVDGYMARKDGATVLGALLDPVADKLFMAALLLPIVAMRDCPAWAAGLVFARELLITALRSSMAVRKAPLKTSQLGKLKTVVQMGGLATYFLTVNVEGSWVVHAICAAIMVVVAIAWGAKKRAAPPLWLTGGAVMWVGVTLAAWRLPPHDAAFWQFMLMVVVTWVSGFDYLSGASKMYRAGGIERAELARIFWAISVGFFAVAVVDDYNAAAMPILFALAAELSLGGIDNVVAAERGRLSSGRVLPSALLATLLVAVGALGLRVDFGFDASLAVVAAAILLAVVGLANAARAYRADRDVFAAV
jgi:CDP-diacylglycerol--glycerol-3-phosphate 3-phosphatidyltransferase